MVRQSTPPVAAYLPLAALFTPPTALAVGVTNGDFATGDYTGWGIDTDGGPGGGTDFSIAGTPGAYRAQIDVDYWTIVGDISSSPLNAVLFANTLSQELDTALAPGALMRLTFDWVFAGEDGNATDGDIFSAALNDGFDNLYGADGLLGFLIDPMRLYGSGSYSATLDSAAFGNQTGWFLEIQVAVGLNGLGEPNALGSRLQIANVGLTEVFPTPAPAPLALVLLGLPLLMRRARAGRGIPRQAGRGIHPVPNV